MMTDPIADMLTRIRNALQTYRARVDVPSSKLKKYIVDLMVREGYLLGYDELDTQPAKTLRIRLKYGPDREQVIRSLDRISKPGRRVYHSAGDISPVLSGFGTGVYSTSRGILSDRECRDMGIGGECICRIT
jgi:small subunit ribosomal protein S8